MSRTFLLQAALLLAAAGPAGAQPIGIEQAHHAHYIAEYDRSLALYEQLAAQGDAEAAERGGRTRSSCSGWAPARTERRTRHALGGCGPCAACACRARGPVPILGA